MSQTEKIEALPDAPPDTDLALCARWRITYPQLLEERANALVFRFPMPRNLTNRSGGQRSSNWRTIHREKDRYWNHCSNLYLARQLPHEPAEPWSKARILSRMILGGAMDDDNAMARHKWAIDWLVAYRYIVSDRKTCLTWGDFPEQKVTRKEEPTLIITLCPIRP